MSVLSEVNQKRVEDLLVEQGIITLDEIVRLKSEAESKSEPLISYLLKNKKVTEEELTKVTAKALNIPYVNLSTAQINEDVLKLLSQDIAERFMAVPLGEMQNRLVVAMLDADNIQAIDYLSQKIERPLKVYMASENGIRQVIEQMSENKSGVIPGSHAGAGDLASITKALSKDDEDQITNKKSVADASIGDSPISKALNTILEYAANTRASDVHIEPLENDLRIRIRVDGVLREIMKLPKSTEAALVSRVKILARLKIDEHRIPQDGQFTVNVGNRDIDLRIAISPTVWGEQIVIRLLDKERTSLKLEDMGFTGRALRTVRKGLKNPNGMILTSGPTGSGKSTTLYASMQEIITDEINIVTLEDPVEYKIKGVNQIQINPQVGLTFASGLRSVLRQDPNVVMVGEIRDGETANLAVQAALTGHLVFSTLHTNSAAGILPRLLDMKIEPFLIASTVKTVIGQRLVRRITKDKVHYQSSKSETQAINKALGDILPKTKEDIARVAKDLGYQTLPLANQNAYTLYKGKESKKNPNGFEGRIGLYEVFEISDQIEDLILKRSTSGDIDKAARSQGMISMRQDGYLKALAGLTTIDEVNRVAAGGE